MNPPHPHPRPHLYPLPHPGHIVVRPELVFLHSFLHFLYNIFQTDPHILMRIQIQR